MLSIRSEGSETSASGLVGSCLHHTDNPNLLALGALLDLFEETEATYQQGLLVLKFCPRLHLPLSLYIAPVLLENSHDELTEMEVPELAGERKVSVLSLAPSQVVFPNLESLSR